ncbi:MAG: hypothetical protein HY657_03865 [Acidobacteria bacterium]|nr:hypothetical protein [Acidobacteriota bacterium]
MIRVSAACLLTLLATATGAGAEPSLLVSRTEGQLLNRAVPDVPVQRADGRTVILSSLWQDRPLLVTFFYRNCHGICSPWLAWVRNAIRDDGGLGRNYRMLALSFDETDTVGEMRSQAEALGLGDDPEWFFAVADREALERLTGALDFWYRLDPATGQYDHSALLVAVDNGRVVRALVGGSGFTERFRIMARELRGDFLPVYTVPNQAAWRCFSFDPVSGRVSVDWGLLLLGLPTLTAMTVTFGLFRRGPRRG